MITEEQRELRKKYVGSSDSAAIMGVDPYKSAAEVWLEKTGRVDPFLGNENTERGDELEPVLLKWAEKRLNAALLTSFMRVHPDGVLAANFDGYQPKVHVGGGDHGPVGGVNDEPFIVEAKTSVNRDEWGDVDFSDLIPPRVIIQVHHQFCLAPECRIAYVPVMLPGFKSFDKRLFKVVRDDSLAAAVEEHARRFWREHVEKDLQPADFRPPIDVIKRIRRQPKKTVPLSAELVAKWEAAKTTLKAATESEEQAKCALLAALGDAECGDCGNGQLVTYFECNRKGYVVKDSTFRQLRLKAAKE